MMRPWFSITFMWAISIWVGPDQKIIPAAMLENMGIRARARTAVKILVFSFLTTLPPRQVPKTLKIIETCYCL